MVGCWITHSGTGRWPGSSWPPWLYVQWLWRRDSTFHFIPRLLQIFPRMSTFSRKIFLSALVALGSGSVSLGLSCTRGGRGLFGTSVDASSLNSTAAPNLFSHFFTSHCLQGWGVWGNTWEILGFLWRKTCSLITCIPAYWPDLASGHSQAWSKLFRRKTETPAENDDPLCGLVSDNLGLNSALITYYVNSLVPQILMCQVAGNFNTNLLEFFVQLNEIIYQTSLAQYACH